jgi:type VI secretion system protein ImpF
MAGKNQGDVTVTLSVLDRLIDHEPKSQTEAALTRSMSVRQMKAAVRRDLEWLLNTRRIAEEPHESLREVNRSLYVYGLPDLSTYNINIPSDQAKLIRQIQADLKLFEPRLANVRIVPLERPVTGMQEFRIRIEAMLLMDPSPEPISFDTVLELKSGLCRFSGSAYAG